MGLVGELLDRAARATPAAVEHCSNGWRLRLCDAATWWSGAVIAHGGDDDLAGRIAAAEQFYAEHNAVPLFQVCPDCPPSLDQLLAERDYRHIASIELMTRSGEVNQRRSPTRLTVRIDDSRTPDWLTVYAATGLPGLDADQGTRLLDSIGLPQAYVTVLRSDVPVAIGRAVLDAGWSGIFNMATIGEARRLGAGLEVLAAIARWAGERHCHRQYLQVEESNRAGHGLYVSAGFQALAGYHYRTAATP